MNSYLAYSYSTGFTKEEQTKIDEKTKKSRQEFTKGFIKGTSFSLAAYSFYLLTTSAAHAADSNVPQPAPKTPGDTVPVQPTPTPPTPKPGFKPVSEKAKGLYVGVAGSVCAAAAQTGDFFLGLACVGLLVIGGIIMNRPMNQP